MFILDFIKKLSIHFSKDSVLEEIRLTTSAIDQFVIPSYLTASDYFRTNKLKSKEALDLSAKFYRSASIIGRNKQPNFISEIYQMFKIIRENCETIGSQLEEILEADIISDGLTAKKAVLLRAVEQISFATDYATTLLNVIYAYEAEDISGIAPVTIKEVVASLNNFAIIISDYSISNHDFKKKLEIIPDAVIGGKAGAVAAGIYKEKTLDPFSTGIVTNFNYNPFYIIGKFKVELKVSRYKAATEKKKVLELRLLYLQQANENKGGDAKLEKEIEYLQGRINKLEKEIKDIADSVGE